VTHARRGNPRGAITLLRRGAARIRGWSGLPADSAPPGPRPYGIDLGFVTAQAEAIAARVDADGLSGLAEADLRFPLSPPTQG
jgi:hypothetical protein